MLHIIHHQTAAGRRHRLPWPAASDKRIDFLRQPRQSRRGDRHAYRAILENAGKRVIIQNWDFKNRSFMERMQATHTSGGRVVALLRPTIRAVRRSGRTPSQTTHSTVKVWSLP
jgi:hypothetical protein